MTTTGLSPFSELSGLLFAGLIYASIKKVKVSNQKMVEISDAIHDGAMVFLRREYGILLVFIVLACGLLSWAVSVWTAVAFVLGAGVFHDGWLFRAEGGPLERM